MMSWRHHRWLVVDTLPKFREMLDCLKEATCIAVDTEANGLFAYRERVSLLQVSTPSQDFIVDPLVDIPVEELGAVFANPQVEKVFHAAEHDLIGLYRDFGLQVSTLFDTMHAARLLGKRRVGLAALLEAYFGVRVNKRYQRANWGKRPLPPEMLAYARMDTHFLIPLRERLREELVQRGLWDLAQEDFARLARVRVTDRTFEPRGFWRLPGAHALPPSRWAVLQALYVWREEEAKRRDVPPFRVLSNKALVELARAAPRDVAALRRLLPSAHGISKHNAREVVTLIQDAIGKKPPLPPTAYPPVYRERLERLRAWRREVAQEEGVPSDIVLPRDAMVTIARENPRTMEELAALDVLGPVRLRRYGERILAVLRPGHVGHQT